MSLRMALGPLMVCSALFTFGHVATAQTKVGVINLQKAVLESAEIKAASAAMEARYKPRVALLDIGMPKLNGNDLARKIREQPWGRDMLLIALSGWGQRDDRPQDLGRLDAALGLEQDAH